MPRLANTTNAQSRFLRAFHTSPTGPAPIDWPSPAILRRWLRRPSFRAALASLESSLRIQADFHLTHAATATAQRLATDPQAHASPQADRLLRLSHLRTRFAPAHRDPQSQIANHQSQISPPQSATRNPKSAIPTDDDTNPSQIDHRNSQTSPGLHLSDRFLDPTHSIHGAARHAFLHRFHPFATRFGYLPPLERHPDFPATTRPTDNPLAAEFHDLLHNPDALLWYLKLFAARFPDDTRFARILNHCREITPHENPAGPFPRCADAPRQPAPPFPHLPPPSPEVIEQELAAYARHRAEQQARDRP